MMFVIKVILSTLIVGITGYIGWLKARRLKDREYILREMVTFLGMVQNEMKYNMAVLPNACEVARQKLTTALKPALGQIVVDMLACENIAATELSMVENISQIEGLTDYDKNVFVSLLKNLGRSDLDSQMNIIQNGICVINNQIEEANQVKLKNSKLYKTVGVIAGLMIVVICI